MSKHQRGRGIGLVALAAAATAALIAVAMASAGGAGPTACGTVTLNENSWVGSTANVYVVKNVLEKKLKCSVKVTNITENQPSFQAMADGKIDVVLEDWDNTLVPSNKKYLTSHAVVPGRSQRDHRRDRLVHPALPAQAVPDVQDVEGAQGQGERVQDRRSRLPTRGRSSAAIPRTSRRIARSSRSSSST